MAKIYVASSWRNTFQQDVVRALREDGHTVYDFKGDGDGWGKQGGGPGGFSWSEVDPEWQTWPEDVPRYLEGLRHLRAEEGFRRDMDALRQSDVCVMVMPCGPSASMEMGWACGADRFVAVYIPGMREPDLMVKMADLVTTNLDQVREAIKEHDDLTPAKYSKLEQDVAFWYVANGGRGTLQSRVARAQVELLEALVEASSTPPNIDKLAEELADTAICLTAAANKLGVSLTAEMEKKMEINWLRKWQVSEDGNLKHVKGSDPREAK